MIASHLGHARPQSRGIALRAISGILVVSGLGLMAALSLQQVSAPVPLAPPPPVADTSFDATRSVILSPDLDRSAALVWVSEDRHTLSVTSQHLSSNGDPQGVWAMPPNGNWMRIGSAPGTDEVAIFNLGVPLPQGTRIAVVLEGGGSAPGLIRVSGVLP